MEFLGNRKKTDAELLEIFSVLGYRIFIPKCYYNPISYLRPNCPVWILSTNNIDCEVFKLEEDNAYTALVNLIKTRYSNNKGYYCTSSFDELEPLLNGINYKYHKLSIVCLNESDEIKSMVLINNEPVQENCFNIMEITMSEPESMDYLKQFLFNDNTIRNNLGIKLIYKPKNIQEEEIAKRLGLIKKESYYVYEFKF